MVGQTSYMEPYTHNNGEIIYIYIFDIDIKCRTCYFTYNGEANSIHICIICGNLILMKNYIYIYIYIDIYIYILGRHIFEIYLIYVVYACKHEALHENSIKGI